MACQCADNWSTTRLASDRGLTWRVASSTDHALVDQFLANGGTGIPSVDKFVREDLLNYADQRYANTFFLVDGAGLPVGFVSNSMASVQIPDGELLGRNMLPIRDVPFLFLHRLGVLVSHKRTGLGSLLVWRVFETLAHSCINSAAAGIALLVDPGNADAKAFYDGMSFAHVGKRGKYELLMLPFEGAVEQIPPAL